MKQCSISMWHFAILIMLINIPNTVGIKNRTENRSNLIQQCCIFPIAFLHSIPCMVFFHLPQYQCEWEPETIENVCCPAGFQDRKNAIPRHRKNRCLPLICIMSQNELNRSKTNVNNGQITDGYQNQIPRLLEIPLAIEELLFNSLAKNNIRLYCSILDRNSR